jgi:hypothetical protein
MKKYLSHTMFIFFYCGLFFCSSCKKEKPGAGGNVVYEPPVFNPVYLPVANAGPYQAITLPMDSACLDGSASYAPLSSIQKWEWWQYAGPDAFLIASSTKTVVKNLVAGTHWFRLKITGSDGKEGTSLTRVDVKDPSDTLSPRGILFENLEWKLGNDGTFDVIYLWVPNDSSNSIPSQVSANLKVWVKRDPDNSSTWEQATYVISNGNDCTAPFKFEIYPNRMWIQLCYPWDSRLIGNKAEVLIDY